MAGRVPTPAEHRRQLEGIARRRDDVPGWLCDELGALAVPAGGVE